MTDTTGIKALPKMTLDELLIRCTDYDDGSLSMDAGELKMLNQHISLLEAERQRAADLVLHVNTQANMREKAESELAALKPEINWPVAQKVRAALDRVACPDAFMRIAVEACTAPQKPVEHPDTRRMDWLCAHTVQVRDPMFYGSHSMFWSQCDSDDCEEHHTKLREQVDAAIEAAGGLPIPQATLEATPQKPVISKEKLCDWLEDNFDIDDSQRDAFAQCFAHHCNCIVKKENE